MSMSNDELAQQFKSLLGASDQPTAFDGDSSPDEDNPLESDFFKAINAFRAARSGGDAKTIAEAERRLQEVVRGELTGQDCTDR